MVNNICCIISSISIINQSKSYYITGLSIEWFYNTSFYSISDKWYVFKATEDVTKIGEKWIIKNLDIFIFFVQMELITMRNRKVRQETLKFQTLIIQFDI